MDTQCIDGVNLEVLRIAAPALGGARADARPVVFLHEGLGSVAMWRDFPQALCAATGRAGLVYSRRGYGRSDAIADVRGKARLPIDYMHREAWDVLPQLLRSEQISKPILLGHSDGASIALLYASRFTPSACIVMAPHLFVEDMSIAAITKARQAFEDGSGTLRSRLAQYHSDVDCAFWQWNDIWLDPAFRRFNIEAECQRITCPLLAIQGLDDPYGSLRQIQVLGAGGDAPISKTNRTLHTIEQCGHAPHLQHRAAVLDSIAQWLREQCI